jgi:DNA-binding transcriptional LysR family regulator
MDSGRVELRHLRYFVAVAEELHFRRAAERLRIAQSPLSQQIMALEHDLGVNLFLRDKHRVELTHAGEVFLPEARDLLERAKAAATIALRAQRGEHGRLRIGYLTSATSDLLSQVVRSFKLKHPKVDLVMHDMVPDAVVAGLEQGTLDAGVLRSDRVLGHAALGWQELWRDPLMVALPRDHWLAKKSRISIRWLKDETFIMISEGSSMGYNEMVRAACAKGRFVPSVQAEANQMQAIIWLVHLGLGVALVPAALQALQRSNVVYVPVDPPQEAVICLAWSKRATSPVLDSFREVARMQCSEPVPATVPVQRAARASVSASKTSTARAS